MPRAISFAWTTPALLHGDKTCTRRQWKDGYARTFKAGELLHAYDRQPRFGGKKIAFIRLTAAPEFTDELPDEDWEREGFAYLEDLGAKVDGLTPRALWSLWRRQREPLWVVRFEVLDYLTGPLAPAVPA